jgi:hypothetical protein
MSSVSRPPLTEREVADAQLDLGIVFPAEYRDYLLLQGGDGAVARLEKTDQGWWWAGNSPHRRALLATPFPHPDSYAEQDDALHARMPQARDFGDEASCEAALQSWVRECEAFDERKTAGAIIAQENGCGFATLLVLIGPLAGTMWWDGRATCDLIVPLSLDHPGGAQPVTLHEWLERGSWSLLPPGWG